MSFRCRDGVPPTAITPDCHYAAAVVYPQLPLRAWIVFVEVDEKMEILSKPLSELRDSRRGRDSGARLGGTALTSTIGSPAAEMVCPRLPALRRAKASADEGMRLCSTLAKKPEI